MNEDVKDFLDFWGSYLGGAVAGGIAFLVFGAPIPLALGIAAFVPLVAQGARHL